MLEELRNAFNAWLTTVVAAVCWMTRISRMFYLGGRQPSHVAIAPRITPPMHERIHVHRIRRCIQVSKANLHEPTSDCHGNFFIAANVPHESQYASVYGISLLHRTYGY